MSAAAARASAAALVAASLLCLAAALYTSTASAQSAPGATARVAAATAPVSTAPVAPAAGAVTPGATALPPTTEVAAICADATSARHCIRKVEAIQLRRFPQLARREGDRLVLELRGAPASFDDTGERAYAFWGYLAAIDAVAVYAQAGDSMHMLLVLRPSGASVELANEPLLSPDAARVATVDFCDVGCDNEIVIWRIDAAAVRKERYYRPRTRWLDVSARWKDGDTLVIERRTEALPGPASFEFRLGDPGWVRLDGR